MLFLFSASAAFAAQTQVIGGRWLTEGSGFAEKDILRVALTADGYIDIISTNTDDIETISGYRTQATLHATRMEFNAWSSNGSYSLSQPLTISHYNPTLTNPLMLPTFKVNGLEYTVTFTSSTSGTVKIRGNANIDLFGNCEINADCALWREGSAKPDIPNSESGCNTLGGAHFALLIPLLFLKKRQPRP